MPESATPIPASVPTATSAAPDWNTLTIDPPCPLCGYNLRGLVEPRCPECGGRFQWDAVLNPVLHHHPYLFEHRIRRPIRAYLKTFVAGLFPSRFWRNVWATHTIYPGRLIVYLFVTVLIALMPFAILACPTIITDVWNFSCQMNAPSRRSFINSPPPSVFGFSHLVLFVRAASRMVWRTVLKPELAVIGFMFAWVTLTLVSLALFRTTISRHRLPLTQVLRCVVYSSDAIFVGVLLLPIFFNPPGNGHFPATVLWTFSPYPIDESVAVALVPILLTFIELAFIYRLFIAYRFYLRLRSPIWIATGIVSTQVMLLVIAYLCYIAKMAELI